MNTKCITLRLDNEMHKAIKLIALEEESTMQDYLVNLIKKDLQERKEEENNI